MKEGGMNNNEDGCAHINQKSPWSQMASSIKTARWQWFVGSAAKTGLEGGFWKTVGVVEAGQKILQEKVSKWKNADNREINVSGIKQRHRKSGIALNSEGSFSNEIETAPLALLQVPKLVFF